MAELWQQLETLKTVPKERGHRCEGRTIQTHDFGAIQNQGEIFFTKSKVLGSTRFVWTRNTKLQSSGDISFKSLSRIESRPKKPISLLQMFDFHKWLIAGKKQGNLTSAHLALAARGTNDHHYFTEGDEVGALDKRQQLKMLLRR